jgi:hypothetical protein
VEYNTNYKFFIRFLKPDLDKNEALQQIPGLIRKCWGNFWLLLKCHALDGQLFGLGFVNGNQA